MRRAYIQLHISIFLWGFTGIFGRAIDLTEGVLVWYRLLLTTLCWIIISFFTKKIKRLSLREILRIVPAGFLVAVHWVLFYGSIKYSNVSVGMSCLALMAVFSAIMEPIFTGRKFEWQELFLAVFAVLGMFLIFTFNQMYETGIIMGVVSAFLASLFTIRNKMLAHHFTSETITLYEIGSGFVFLTLLMPLYLHWFPTDKLIPSGNDWWLLILFVIVCTVIPFNLSLKALKNVTAFASNLSLNMEPVYGIVLAILIYHEQRDLHAGFFIGTGIILLSVMIYVWLKFGHKIRKMAGI